MKMSPQLLLLLECIGGRVAIYRAPVCSLAVCRCLRATLRGDAAARRRPVAVMGTVARARRRGSCGPLHAAAAVRSLLYCLILACMKSFCVVPLSSCAVVKWRALFGVSMVAAQRQSLLSAGLAALSLARPNACFACICSFCPSFCVLLHSVSHNHIDISLRDIFVSPPVNACGLCANAANGTSCFLACSARRSGQCCRLHSANVRSGHW